LINRAALLLRYKEPAVRWIREADPYPSGIPETFERWLKRHYDHFFEMELEGWYTDPALWPPDRSYEMFREWFEPECHTVIVDTCSEEIVDDDL